MLQQIPIILKNASNKNCSELNFLEKNNRTHISNPQKWNYGAPKFATFEIENRITLELNAAKNTDYIKKCVKKLFRIEFPSKNSLDAYVYLAILLRSGARFDPFSNQWGG